MVMNRIVTIYNWNVNTHFGVVYMATLVHNIWMNARRIQILVSWWAAYTIIWRQNQSNNVKEERTKNKKEYEKKLVRRKTGQRMELDSIGNIPERKF